MSFIFAMQKILDYRGQLEEEAKVRLAKAQKLLLREQTRITHMQTQLTDMEGQLYRNLEMDMATRWLTENYVKGLRADIAQSSMRMRQLKEAVEHSRELVLIRSKERKVLEKLKEKQRERHLAAEKEYERKINDETATLRHGKVAF